jgi:hypothetical protein
MTFGASVTDTPALLIKDTLTNIIQASIVVLLNMIISAYSIDLYRQGLCGPGSKVWQKHFELLVQGRVIFILSAIWVKDPNLNETTCNRMNCQKAQIFMLISGMHAQAVMRTIYKVAGLLIIQTCIIE